MSGRSIALQESDSTETCYLQGEPNVCPFCKSKIVAIFRNAYRNNSDVAICNYQCTNKSCQSPFFAYYHRSGYLSNGNTKNYIYDHSMKGTLQNRTFSDIINNTSLKFTEIYNQANEAESLNLDELAGMGYRKSIEFLIKDYCISKQPDKEEEIKAKLLGKCIDDHVNNGNIKEIVKRAVWIGNDETHYVRRWETKDINDLKKLIDISIHWIEMEKLSDEYLIEM